MADGAGWRRIGLGTDVCWKLTNGFGGVSVESRKCVDCEVGDCWAFLETDTQRRKGLSVAIASVSTFRGILNFPQNVILVLLDLESPNI